MKHPFVVGILTFKRDDLLETCVKSVRQHTPDAQLVLANNSSDENYIRKVEELGERFSAAVFSFRKNRGTSAAWNTMARAYDVGRIAILNDDVRVHAGWREALDKTLDDPRMGLVSLSLWNGHHEWDRENALPFSLLPELDRYYTAYPCGSLLAMRKTVFDEVGGFDENLWIGCEEVDFGIRAMRLGYLNANVGVRGESYKFASHYGSATGYTDAHAPSELRTPSGYFQAKHGVPFPLPQDFEERLREESATAWARKATA